MTTTHQPGAWRRLYRYVQGIIASAREYILMQISGDRAGLAIVRDLLRGGAIHRLALAILVLTIVSTAYLAVPQQAFPVVQFEYWPGEIMSLPAPAIYLFLLAFALGWAFMLAATASRGLGLYVLVATYAAYYTMYVGISLGPSPAFALPPLWLLALGAWVASANPNRWRIPLLALLSFIIAVITRNSLGLRALLPGELGWFILAAIYLALVANPWVQKRRAFGPRIAFAITAAVFLIFYSLLAIRTPQAELLPNAFLAAYDLLGFVGLFWYWLGLDLFNGALDLANWLGNTVQRVMPRRPLRVLAFAFWGLAALASYLLVHTPPLAALQFLFQFEWGKRLVLAYAALPHPSITLAAALANDLYVTLAILGVAIVLGLFRRLSDGRLLALLGLSVLGFLILLGYQELMFAEIEVSSPVLGFWPLLIYVGGMAWQLLKAGGDLAKGGPRRTWLFLGFLLFFGGISLLEITTHYPYFDRQLSLNSFLGVMSLGLPYLLYTLIYHKLHYEPFPVWRLVLLFGLGMASAIPSLVLRHVWIAPVAWLAILLITSWRWGGWQRPWDALVASAAVGLGFAAFYTHPILIPLPAFLSFLRGLLQAEIAYCQRTIWPWQGLWWWLVLIGAGAGVLLGLGTQQAQVRRGWRRVLFLALGLLAGVGLAAFTEASLLIR
jgi:hypothetical protein